MLLRRLHPSPGEVETGRLASILALGERAPAGRPYVVANMVTTADGRASIEGRTAKLGGPADRELFHDLRGSVDAVLAGTGTLAVERYGRMVRDEVRRARRADAGLAEDPIAVVLSRSGEIPWEIPLFAEATQEVVLYTEADVQVPAVGARVRVERVAQGDLRPRTALARLRADHGVRSVLCEGGPTLLGALVEDGVLDELFLTVDPQLAGGAEHPVLAGVVLDDPVALELVWVLECDGALFARYGIRAV